MIIVSQKRDKIINFDNVIDISAEGFENSRIVCLTNARLCVPIGMYKSEERAKEVLKEIKNEYIDCNKSDTNYMNYGYGYISNRVYEMPLE